jgi:hypothetical protein
MSSNGMAKCVGFANANMNSLNFNFFTFDHRTLRTRLPVRSALFKQRTGGLVVRWVTTGESPLLNVFFFGRIVLLFALLLPVLGLIKL